MNFFQMLEKMSFRKNILLIFTLFLFIPFFGYSNDCAPSIKKSYATTLYETKRGRFFKWIIGNAYAARVAGWYANRSIPLVTRWHIQSFARTHDIDTSTLVNPNLSSYRTFNDFFTRKLLPSARPITAIDNETVCTSPADGKLYFITDLQETTEFMVKGKPFTLTDFLKDSDQAKKFYGGTMIITYLSPADYHRFHMPCNGQIQYTKHINGTYESVNPSVFKFIQPLQENERHIMGIDIGASKKTEMAYILVGAMFVGQINYTYNQNNLYVFHKTLKKGDELGYFSFGGSTVVLLFPKNSFIVDSSLASAIHGSSANTAMEFEKKWHPIKMGQKIGIHSKQ